MGSPTKPKSVHNRPDDEPLRPDQDQEQDQEPLRPTKQARVEVEAEEQGSKVVVEKQSHKKKTFTDEELDQIKFKPCLICEVEDDHSTSLCPLQYQCISTAHVSPLAEIVCLCCGDPADTAHPSEKYVAGRARLKGIISDRDRCGPSWSPVW